MIFVSYNEKNKDNLLISVDNNLDIHAFACDENGNYIKNVKGFVTAKIIKTPILA